MSGEVVVSFIIPTFKQTDLLRRCVMSILGQSMPHVEVIVVDNGSTVNVKDYLRDISDSRLRIVRLDRNVFLCKAINFGFTHASGMYIATINDDAWISHEWALNAMKRFEQLPELGSLASLVLMEADTSQIDSAGNGVSAIGMASNLSWGRPVSALSRQTEMVLGPSSSCAVYRRSALEKVGLLDAKFTAYYEDVDLSLRLQLAGYVCIFEPSCIAWHRRGATIRSRFRSAYLIERNRVWTIGKNFPGPVLRRYGWRIAMSILRPTPIAGGSPFSAFILGRAVSIIGLLWIYKSRRQIQANATVAASQIEALMRSGDPFVCRL
jgi:GT2 family glycosyltransferase